MITVVIWVALLAIAAHSMRTLSTSVTPQLLWLLGGLMAAYVVGKFFEWRSYRNMLKPLEFDSPANAPTDYLEYARIQALLKKYEAQERFSWRKLPRGLVQGKTYGKALVIGIAMFVMAFVGLSVYTEARALFFPRPTPIVNTIKNTGGGTVESKTENKTETHQRNGFNLSIF